MSQQRERELGLSEDQLVKLLHLKRYESADEERIAPESTTYYAGGAFYSGRTKATYAGPVKDVLGGGLCGA